MIDVSDVIGEAIRYLYMYLYLYSCVALYLFFCNQVSQCIYIMIKHLTLGQSGTCSLISNSLYLEPFLKELTFIVFRNSSNLTITRSVLNFQAWS